VGEGKGRREEKGREGGREGIRQVSRPTGGLRGKGVIPPRCQTSPFYSLERNNVVRCRSKIVATRHVSWAKKTIKIAFAANALPGNPLGQLTAHTVPLTALVRSNASVNSIHCRVVSSR